MDLWPRVVTNLFSVLNVIYIYIYMDFENFNLIIHINVLPTNFTPLPPHSLTTPTTISHSLTHCNTLLEGVDPSPAQVLAVALEEAEEVAREESIELQEEVVHGDVQVHHQLMWGQT